MHKFLNYRYQYPYIQVYPAALNDQVSGKGDKRKQIFCQQEMSQMLTCLKKYDFDQARCPKEIQQFVSCSKTFAENPELTQAASHGRYPTDVLNSHLRKYPQPKVKTD